MTYHYPSTPSQSAYFWSGAFSQNFLPQNLKQGLLGLIQGAGNHASSEINHTHDPHVNYHVFSWLGCHAQASAQLRHAFPSMLSTPPIDPITLKNSWGCIQVPREKQNDIFQTSQSTLKWPKHIIYWTLQKGYHTSWCSRNSNNDWWEWKTPSSVWYLWTCYYSQGNAQIHDIFSGPINKTSSLGKIWEKILIFDGVVLKLNAAIALVATV